MESKNDQDSGRISRIKLRLKKIPRWLKWIFGLIIVLSMVIIGIIEVISQYDGKVIPVNTIILGKQDIERTVMANGHLESIYKQEFFTPVDSTLMELKVEVGDRVTKGQILGRLDTLELGRRYEEARAKLAEKEAALARAKSVSEDLNLKFARAQYEKAKNHLERIEFLYQQGTVTVEEVETARVDCLRTEKEYQEVLTRVDEGATDKEILSLNAQVDLARQEVAQAQERLELATFIAQKDGVVLFVGAEKGNRVLEGSRLLEIGSEKELKVTAYVNEMDAGSLQVGQPVKITCAAIPGKHFEGEVSRVGVAAISQERSGVKVVNVPVTVKLLGDSTSLKLGYTVDLSIVTMQKENILTLPIEALLEQQGQKVVYVVENDLAKKREVQTEPGNELYDIIVSGLNEGDTVILNPPANLKDGQQVVTNLTGEVL